MALKMFVPQQGPGRFANVEQGDAYSFPFFEIDPTLVDDLIVYMQNTGIRPIEISRISLVSIAAAGVHLIQKVTGTAAGGQTTVTPVNMDLSSSKTLTDVVCQTDPDITGLTEVATIDTFGLLSGEGKVHNYPEGIILRQGDAIAISDGHADAVLSGSIFFHVLPEGPTGA